MKITLSIVSHGQRDIALCMLEDILRLSPPDVAEIIYTANIPERDLPALNMGHIRLVVIRNETPKGLRQQPQHRLLALPHALLLRDEPRTCGSTPTPSRPCSRT